MENNRFAMMKQGEYRDFIIPEDGKKRMIIAPDFKRRVNRTGSQKGMKDFRGA